MAPPLLQHGCMWLLCFGRRRGGAAVLVVVVLSSVGVLLSQTLLLGHILAWSSTFFLKSSGKGVIKIAC